MSYRTKIADNAVLYPGKPSKWHGICHHCGQDYWPGDLVTWTRKVKGSTCHASCYKVYGTPTVTRTETVPTRTETVATRTETVPVVVADEVDVVTDTAVTATDVNPSLGKLLAEYVFPYLDGKLKSLVSKTEIETTIKTLCKDMVFKHVTEVTITQETDNGFETRNMGIQHMTFPDLLMACKARKRRSNGSLGNHLNIWLVGPAGTGKTTAAENIAKALDLPFFFTGSIDTEYKLLGFINAQGQVINTAFRKAYIEGGVFLFDECDSSLPQALLAFNAALANDSCAFPDGVYQRHSNFLCIAAANTWGLGATIEYVGRLKMDAAFLDRFVQLEWAVDENLEMATAPNTEWTSRVQTLRARAKAKGLKVMITPRSSYDGAALLEQGLPQDLVERMTMRKGMSQMDWEAINA